MFAAAVGLLLAACGSGSTHATAPRNEATTRAPTHPAPSSAPATNGCGHATAAGSATMRITVAGRSRTIIVHIPRGYTGTRALPLVLNLHGSGSTAAHQELLTGMDRTADADSFFVVYPQALIPDGAGFVWNIPGVPLIGGAPVPPGAANDEAFLEQVVATMRARTCIDPRRVYATGLSGGARMSSQLGCDAATTFAAVGPVSGLRLPAPCDAARPVPVISFHGRLDPIDPYNGNGQPYWTYSVPEAARRWAAHNGCASTAQLSEPAPGVTLTTYAACRRNAAVELYTIAAEGHEWPGGPGLPHRVTRVLGPQTDVIAANTVMWKFFTAHPMP